MNFNSDSVPVNELICPSNFLCRCKLFSYIAHLKYNTNSLSIVPNLLVISTNSCCSPWIELDAIGTRASSTRRLRTGVAATNFPPVGISSTRMPVPRNSDTDSVHNNSLLHARSGEITDLHVDTDSPTRILESRVCVNPRSL